MPTKKRTKKLPVTRTAGPSSERAWLDAYLRLANAEPGLLKRTESRVDLERAFRYQLELDHAHGVLSTAGRFDGVDGLTWSKVSLAWHRSASLPFDSPPAGWLRTVERTAKLVTRRRDAFRRQLMEVLGALRSGSAASLRKHRARANVNLQDVRVDGAVAELDDEFRLHYDLRYRPANEAGMHGLLWAFLLDKDRGFGATLGRCALQECRDAESNALVREACGRFYFAEPVAGGGRLSKFCSDDCRATNGREMHAALMRRARNKRQAKKARQDQ